MEENKVVGTRLERNKKRYKKEKKELDKQVKDIEVLPIEELSTGRKVAEFISTAIVILVAVVLILSSLNYLTRKYIVRDVYVKGSSMANTIHDKDVLTYVKATSFIEYEPKRFRIVIFQDPRGSNEQYIKRIIGMPNDIVEYRDNKLYVNGIYYEEEYLDDHREEGMEMMNFKVTVPSNSYFVMGDNRLISEDSRDFGSVNQKYILGIKTPYKVPSFNINNKQVEEILDNTEKEK